MLPPSLLPLAESSYQELAWQLNLMGTLQELLKGIGNVIRNVLEPSSEIVETLSRGENLKSGIL